MEAVGACGLWGGGGGYGWLWAMGCGGRWVAVGYGLWGGGGGCGRWGAVGGCGLWAVGGRCGLWVAMGCRGAVGGCGLWAVGWRWGLWVAVGCGLAMGAVGACGLWAVGWEPADQNQQDHISAGNERSQPRTCFPPGSLVVRESPRRVACSRGTDIGSQELELCKGWCQARPGEQASQAEARASPGAGTVPPDRREAQVRGRDQESIPGRSA